MNDEKATIKFFQWEELAAMLQLTEEEIEPLEEARVILGLMLADGEKVYPTFQFYNDELTGELISLFQLFDPEITPWEITLWFHRESEALGVSPLAAYELGLIDQLRLLISTEMSLMQL